MAVDEISLDYETRSRVPFGKTQASRGLDVYSSDPSTKALMCSWRINKGRVYQWEHREGKFPGEVREALLDPHVKKKAFNAQFERFITRRVLGIPTPIEGWRCTMVRAYLLSFSGGLGMVAQQMGLPVDLQKDKRGDKLIQMFTKPQRITKNQPHEWFDHETHPIEYAEFMAYNEQDVVAEGAVDAWLEQYPIPEEEWLLYEMDQKWNDRGLPIDLSMCSQATKLAIARKNELMTEMKKITGLPNPNSPVQLTKWAKTQGYRFNDLGKDTVKIVMKEGGITDECQKVLKMRLQTGRTSVGKYVKFVSLCGPRGRLRNPLQFAGAQRTARWAGRGVQLQNLGRTPKILEPHGSLKDGTYDDHALVWATDAIRNGDMDELKLIIKEPMDAIAGCVRSAIRAPDDSHLVICDLASIESVVIGWLAGCGRLLQVFKDGRDAYRDFATELFKCQYDEVTSSQRSLAKPATLGAGYRLGGGDLDKNGKRTGLWGYAENMGVDMTKEEAHKSVRVFRETYPEIPEMWKALEACIIRTIKTRATTVFRKFIEFSIQGPFLRAKLPSGRYLYYNKPRVEVKTWQSKDRKTGAPLFEKDGITPKTYTTTGYSYMGFNQEIKKWIRIDSHGGKTTENLVQAIAREILKYGLIEADRFGFRIILHVHDEIVAEQKKADMRYTASNLRMCMIKPQPWYKDMPLGAAAGTAQFYRKD
jgi:DNA polymerase